MAIFTRFGSAIELTEARLFPVWIMRGPGEIKWHYTEPKTRRGWKLDELRPCWHFKAVYAETREPLCDGKWIGALESIVADNGWSEIADKLAELGPADVAMYDTWNRKGAPEADCIFSMIDAKEVA